MTRINVILVSELCDKHLFAEFREITRIPNLIKSGKYSLENQPNEYCLGNGHVKFFYDKLAWLDRRYTKLTLECKYRGFAVNPINDVFYHLDSKFYKWYEPTQDAVIINKQRIIEKLPKHLNWTKRDMPKWVYDAIRAE